MHQPQPLLDTFLPLAPAALLDRYSRGVERLERRLLDLTDSQLDTFFRPDAAVGRWSCRVLVGHLADAEIVNSHRMRRAVAEDNPLVAQWDENAFIDNHLYGDPERPAARIPVAGHVALIHTTRLWTADWLRTLLPHHWSRRALHPQRGEMTVHSILATTTWHLEHHAWYLSQKLAKLLGEP
jgi:hypothetical protein